MKKINYKWIGQETIRARKKRGYTQGKLAENICTQAQISKIENGDAYPSAEVLYKISEKLGITVDYLFKGANDTNFEYIKEVSQQLQAARRNMNYDEIYELVRHEKKGSLFKKNIDFQQLILWHEGLAIHEIFNENDKSLRKLEEALYLTYKPKNVYSEREIEICNSMMVVFFENEQYEKLLTKSKELLDDLETIQFINDPTIKTRIIYNRAKALTRLCKYQDSIHLCKKGINWCIDNDSMNLFAELYYHRGFNHEKLNNLPKAIQYIEKSLKLFEAINDYKYVEYLNNRLNSLRTK